MRRLFAKIGLLLLAVVFGGAVGSLAAVFMRLLYSGIDFLWHQLPELLGSVGDFPFYTLILTAVGGLLVGLCQRYLGDYPKPLQETIAAFRQSGRFEYKHIGQALTTASTSLLFGASLGPEAALMDMAGGSSTWAGDQLKRVGLRLGIVKQDGAETAWPRNWKWLLIAAALLAGITGFALFIGDIFSGGFVAIGQYEFTWVDLLYAVPMGLVGTLGGLFYLQLQKFLPILTRKLEPHPILRSMAGGVIFGLLATIFPLVLFSGQKELQPLFDSQVSQVAWFILCTGLAKLFVTSLLLSTGWKGGHILPVMFGGAAVGLGVSLFLPGIPPVIGYVAGMAGATIVVMRQPIFVALFLGLIFPLPMAGVILVAITVGYFASKSFASKPVRTTEKPGTENWVQGTGD